MSAQLALLISKPKEISVKIVTEQKRRNLLVLLDQQLTNIIIIVKQSEFYFLKNQQFYYRRHRFVTRTSSLESIEKYTKSIKQNWKQKKTKLTNGERERIRFRLS